MLMFTCGVRDFKKAFPDVRINVIATAMHIFDHNPNLDRTLVGTPENIIEIGPSKLTNKSNSLDWHFANAFRMSMEEKLNITIPQGDSRPDVYFTKEEWDAPRVIDKPYWIISTTGEKGWGCKMYPQHKWQEVIDQNPDITFVQIGTAEDNAPRLKGSHVIDYVGKTQSRDNGIRDLFKLFLNSEGSIGLVSFHMHLMGGLNKPCVVIAGAREPVSFTRYAGHAYLSNDGMLPCAVTACWHCSIDACTNLVIREDTAEKKIPKCADIIESEDISRAIRGYYKGGRLVLGTPSDKPKRFKNIVPTPAFVAKPIQVEAVAISSDVNTYGMSFGGGSLTDRDWAFISGAIKKYSVRTVLEFGAGLSTLLFYDAGVKTVTYESKQGWIDKIKSMQPKVKIQLWDGVNMDMDHRPTVCFDMAFVDGPAGDQAREHSTALAALMAKVVVVHDAGREWAIKYQAQYLAPHFNGPFRGGHRCYLWIRKGIEVKDEVKGREIFHVEPVSTEVTQEIKEKPACIVTVKPIVSKPLAVGQKSIKIVSTAKGWGGCARSVTTIMKFLLDAGHRVQFIPFKNVVGSREYQEILKGELKGVDVALGYNALHEACDVLLVYADDYVWEFKTDAVAEIFSEINAEKKIMMLNYRRGEVGKTPWTQGWDQYLFLCSMQEQELLKVYPAAAGKTKVLAPCTLLEPFLDVHPEYGNGIRIVRHNSQGDAKFINTQFTIDDCKAEIQGLLDCRPDLSISMLPGPSFMDANTTRFGKVSRTADPNVIAQFLATGNLYWYSLPFGYMDMGPRVILEAMAAGLPVMADSWSGGAKDRVIPGCGLIASDKNWRPWVENLTVEDIRKMGSAAKAHAYNEFRPEKWMEVLLA
jgi:ADP-heptose:LPS heptosyltransferase/glycosyltransferase involved in cell wall biosynthesis